MKCPTLREEKKLWKAGYKRVICLDEAGRGPLAGPVVAAAVTVSRKNLGFRNLILKDSKKLIPKRREELYKILTKHPDIKWGAGRVSEKMIDKINILEATKIAMGKAIQNLNKKQKRPCIKKSCDRRIFRYKDFLILDGNFTLPTEALLARRSFSESGAKTGINSATRGEQNRTISQKSIVKADEKVFSCAAASIIAKVTRDRIMEKCHLKYPRYCFDRHKGYPTKLHRRLLRKHGSCQIHRKTFGPVKRLKNR